MNNLLTLILKSHKIDFIYSYIIVCICLRPGISTQNLSEVVRKEKILCIKSVQTSKDSQRQKRLPGFVQIISSSFKNLSKSHRHHWYGGSFQSVVGPRSLRSKKFQNSVRNTSGKVEEGFVRFFYTKPYFNFSVIYSGVLSIGTKQRRNSQINISLIFFPVIFSYSRFIY